MAINFCHEINILHKDIKLDNILVFEKSAGKFPLLKLKLCDFGVSRIIDKENSKFNTSNLCGTPAYIAPELLGGTSSPISYRNQFASDVWSLGILLVMLIINTH